MKIGIIQDVHGNLPALKKGIEIFGEKGCEKIFHVGDLIGIGPYPKECLELACSVKEMEFVMGNHDYWYAHGLPNPIPKSMSEEEVRHQQWTHKEIGNGFKGKVRKWKFSIELSLENEKKITFQHYGLNQEQNGFKSIIKNPAKSDLDYLFEDLKSDLIFYGHHHQPNDTLGKCRYVNLGSAGCHDKPIVRIGVLDILQGKFKLQKLSIAYDDGGLMEEFEKRNVPAREFIKKVFIVRKK